MGSGLTEVAFWDLSSTNDGAGDENEVRIERRQHAPSNWSNLAHLDTLIFAVPEIRIRNVSSKTYFTKHLTNNGAGHPKGHLS